MDAKEARAYLNGSTAYSRTSRRTRGPLIVCAIAAFVFFTIFFSTSSVSEPIVKAAHKLPTPHVPKFQDLHNPFKSPTAHKPPIQSNSSIGTTKWFSDWKWLNPFSSSVTLEDDRVVLPPLLERPIVYTYYEPTSTKKDVLQEEKKLLTIWRRSWWAQGFKPIILGSKEAMQNPNYEALQTRKLDGTIKIELMRWLAWGWMGPGILTNWLLLPMARWDDPDLAFLRRADYGLHLVRYETMTNSIYASSSKDEINKAIRVAIDNAKLDKQTALQDAIPDPHAFTVQVQPTGLALYDMQTLSKEFPALVTQLKDNEVDGLKTLQLLINSHLHGTFLEQFPGGIAVLLPDRICATILASHSVQLAESLNKCPDTSNSASCPPNRSSCRGCQPLKVSYTTGMTNKTDVLTIGVVPHPYTFSLLQKESTQLDIPWIRRTSKRDPFIETVTANLAPKALSAYQKIIKYKNIIASEASKHLFIFHTAEQAWSWKDLEWHFGFSLPAPASSTAGNKAGIAPAPESIDVLAIDLDNDPPLLKDLLLSLGSDRPSLPALAKQAECMNSSMSVMKEDKFKGNVDMREVVEAWNLADTEAWRFVSALNAREKVQRMKWDEEEKRFVGGEGTQ